MPSKIANFLSSIFGTPSWQSPMWIKYCRFYAHTKPKLFWSINLLILLLLSGLFYSYHVYKNLPKPELITANINIPKASPIPEDNNINNNDTPPAQPSIQPLVIEFSKAVAPLNLIGKKFDNSNNIFINPNIQGKWSWQDDKTLIFLPTTDWPAGQKFKVTCNKDFFAQHVKLANYSYAFTTSPLIATISEFKFYQNPTNPKIKEAQATIQFNYPVNNKTVLDKMFLNKQTKTTVNTVSIDKINYTLTYDKFNRTAYLRSVPLQLENQEYYLKLDISKGIYPILGKPTEQTTTKNLLIPSIDSFFKIANVSSTIVHNEQDRPEQILNIETTADVSKQELNKFLHVYLLPRDYPVTANSPIKTNYNWSSPREVTENILNLATPVSLIPIPSDREYSTLHSYKFSIQSKDEIPSYMYIKIDRGLTAYADYTLSIPYTSVVAAPPLPKEISFLHQGAILALNSEKKISILTRGVPAVKIKIARVLPDTINQLVSQTHGQFSNPDFNSYSFGPNNITEVFTEIHQFNQVAPNQVQYLALDLTRYISTTNTRGIRGLFLLEIQGWDPINNAPLNVSNKRLVLVTDLGIIAKDNADDTHDLFLTSITNGQPVAQATITILGKNGLPILNRTTDLNGHAIFPNLKNFIDEQEPTVYLAKLQNDVAFMPYSSYERQLNYTNYDIGGATNINETADNLRAYLFTERGIYRPGNTIHIAGIIKRNYIDNPPSELPLQLQIFDPRHNIISEQKIIADTSGYFSYDYKTTPTSATGEYSINLYLAKDYQHQSYLNSIPVRVDEFLPDRLKLKAQFTPAANVATGWLNPNNTNIAISLQNLYGTPAQNHRVSGKIVLRPQDIKFEQYKDYIFTNPLADTKKTIRTYEETLKDVYTDDNGKAQLKLGLERFAKSIYMLNVLVEGFEKAGGRSVSTKINTLINPLPYLIGYKTNGELNFIKQKSNRSIELISLNQNLKLTAQNNLTQEVFSKQQIATLVKKPNGTYQYETKEQLTLLKKSPLSLAAHLNTIQLNTDKIGSFSVVIKDQQNLELCKFDYSVVGTSQQPIPQNAELSVKLNKNEFQANEDIEMEITAPYVGHGLITLERDKVYAYQWFNTTTTSSIQKIRIPKDFQGDGYVNVAFVRDWNAPEIFISPLSYSVTPFKVTPHAHVININLQSPAVILAGDDLPIKYQSDKPGKIIIFAVDEGILQVSKYKAPDPLNFFFEKHTLQVTTAQILDQILPKYIAERELSAVGGDGGEQLEIDKNLNPFKRKIDAPIVYWSGILDVDNTPRQVVYHVPNYFNGTLHIMAVATAANAVGATEQLTKVGNYFIINPNVPTFAAPGDEFEVTASIANNLKDIYSSQTGFHGTAPIDSSSLDFQQGACEESKRSLLDINEHCERTRNKAENQNAKSIAQDNSPSTRVTVNLNASNNLEILGNNKQILDIKQDSDQVVKFRLRAKDLLGNASLTFTANANNRTSSLTTTLSIRPVIPYFTTITSGYTNKHNITLELERDLYPDLRKVTAAISTNPLILLTGLQNYLENFPYFCTEQIVSKAFVTLALQQQPGLTVHTQQELRNKLQELIHLLQSRQNSSGNFSYWPGENAGDNENINTQFSSLYAIHLLTDAKALNINISSDMLEQGLEYLKEVARKNPTNLEQARLQAYAIYLLTRNEIITTNYLTHLQLYLEQNPQDQQQLWRKDITSAYLAATYKLLQDDKTAENLINYYHPITTINPETNPSFNNFHNDNIANAQYLYLIAKHFPEKLKYYNQKLTTSIVAKLNSHDISTVLAGYSSMALISSPQNAEQPNKDALNITEILANDAKHTANDTLLTINPLTQKIEFNSQNQDGFFYQLTQAGFDKEITPQIFGKYLQNDIEIFREYRDLQGNVITSSQLGQDIEVHIKIRSKSSAYINNVAIVDLLPGGFEVIRDSISNENSSTYTYADVREDRVVFFTSISTEAKEIIYRIKATNNGTYITPPIFVEAMYDNAKKALGTQGKMEVF